MESHSLQGRTPGRGRSCERFGDLPIGITGGLVNLHFEVIIVKIVKTSIREYGSGASKIF